ncbi:hypothetical protein N5938_13580 [Pseudomonas aeruginosa]|nr:hypothetical protein [Pseudomonas aeruginosa]UYM63861.1 hypothetical protein N5938_13580 [Pseudomonas aeruginosa]
MTLPIQYAFEGTHVRIAMINGEPWFVAADVLCQPGARPQST